jgi:NADPH:quinone reductase-like Zn-dependent oxidoreductase
MKAARIDTFGSYEKVVIAHIDTPSPKAGQVLVKVSAASINPFDLTVMSGKMPIPLPITLGGDFAGTVESIASDVTGYNIGDEVYGQAIVLNGGSGSLAEEAVCNTSSMAHKPSSLTMAEAAALPLTGASAVQALEEHIKIKQGDMILIHGGAGGIGTIAIQLAHMYGAHVTTTAGSEARDYVVGLGADKVIDYKTQRFEDEGVEYDAVFDTVGGDITERSLSVIKKGGVLVTMIGQADEAKAKERGIALIHQMTHTTKEVLTRLTELVNLGKIKPHIDKTFELDHTQDAFRYFVEAHPKGKVVVAIS